jgi:DNA primase
VVSLPAGKDPDDFVRERGAEGMQNLLKHARGILEYLIDLALAEELLQEGAEARAKSVQYVTKLIASERDPVLRELAETYADGLVAGRLKIDQDNSEQVRTLRALARAIQARPGTAARGAMGAPAPHRARSRDQGDELGLQALGAVLDFPDLAAEACFDEAAAVVDGEVALAFAALRQAIQGGRLENPEDVLAKLSPPIHSFARARLTAPRHERLEDARRELVGNVTQLRQLEFKREKSEVTAELEQVQRTGDWEQEQDLLRQQEERAKRQLERLRTLRG